MRQRFRSWAGLGAGVLICVAAFSSGCSSSDDDKGSESSNAENGSIFKKLGIKDPKSPTVIFADLKAPYADAAGCKAFPSNVQDAHDCTCDKCFSLQQQCDAIQGCIEIAECGISIGCTDAYSCYLTPIDAPVNKCVPLIDKWGNTGVAAAISLALAACAGDPANGCRE
jgi:hypothetical protein